MLIAGRKEELEILDEIMQKKTSQFVIVYGRRRVGKTYLINEYFNNSFSFKTVGVRKKNKRDNTIRPFYESLIKYGKIRRKPKDWYEAFRLLEEILECDDVYREPITKKRVVFIDELPWFDSPKSSFREAFDYFWNMYGCTQKDLVLIVCGSATSWIVDNLLESKEGFHNRATNRIYLKPLTLSETEELLFMNDIKWERNEIIDCYMTFGGIPYYLNLLSPRYSLIQNIENLCFNDGGALRNELNELFSSLFTKYEEYLDVIKFLGKKRIGFTRDEIVKALNYKSGGKITKILDNLIKCSFIRRYKNVVKGGNDFYQIIDPFTIFALNYINNDKISSWIKYYNTPGYYNYAGLAFEVLCLNNITAIKKALDIYGIESNEYSFKNDECQIDLLIDRKDNVINLCEIKYSINEYVIDKEYHENLNKKIESFRRTTKTKKSIILTMITTSGIKKNMYSNVILKEINAKSLFF